jgi:hypothetical protein
MGRRIILKWVLKNFGVKVFTGLKWQGISRLSEGLSASQKEPFALQN